MKSVAVLFVLALCSLAHGYPPCPNCPPCPPPPPPVHYCKKPEIIWTGDACGCTSTLPYHVEVPKPVELVIPKKDLGYQLAFAPEPVDCKRYIFDYQVQVPIVEEKPIKLHDCGYILDIPPPPPPEKRYRFDYEVEVPCTCTCKPSFLDLSAHVDRIVLPKPDCCIVAEGDCPCNKYKPHIEPLVSCPPPPPKPPKKCKKPKRVECFCEEVDPRYASQCRHKRSIESGENISSIEITNDSSDENDSIIQELPVVACDLENVEKPDNSSQKIDEIGEGNVVSVQVNETKKNKKIEFKLGLKYYVSDPIEYLEDGESKIVYDYLGHKYIEKDGRLQIVKPAFYLEEEVISAEITIEPKSPEANCTEVKDLNTQNVTITVHKANDPTVAKTVNKEVDAIDDLSKNLGSILSLLVQDKHTDLADALGDVLMGMAELEDMKTTLEKDLINKKSKVVRPIEVMKPMEKLPSPIESRPPIPVERLSLPITNRMPAPLDRLPPPLDRLPAQNSNNFPTALDKIPLPIEKIPIPPQRWIQPTENKPSLPVDVLPSPTEKKPQLPSPFMKKLNNDPLQASLLQTGAGLRENLQAQPVDRIQSGLLQNGANLQPQPVDLMQSGLLKNGAGLRENIQVQPIDMRKPIFSDVFNPIVQQHKEIEKIQNKFTDTPKLVSPANEITPEDNVIKNNINTLNKNFIPFNKEFHPGKLLDFNMKNMDSMPKQLSDVQKVQYSPGNSIDNRFQSFKPTNFVQFQQPQQRYQPKPFLTNNFEEQLQD